MHPLEHYISQFFSRSEGKFLTFNPFAYLAQRELRACARVPGRPRKKKKKKKNLARPPREHCASTFFPSCSLLFALTLHTHFLQSISRLALKGTPTKLQPTKLQLFAMKMKGSAF